MVVQFYNFSKKQNSTARPPASALIKSTECYLKEGCSVVNPSIRVAWAADDMLPTYAYIATWGRYYFVKDTSYVNSALIVDLTCDVMATYKTQIGASTQYVLRCAATYDPLIVDTLYPAKAQPTSQRTSASSNLSSTGLFILGVQGTAAANSQPYGLTYYILTPAEMRSAITILNTASHLETYAVDFANGIKNAIDSMQQMLQSLTTDLAQWLFQPFGFVKTCTWVPIELSDFFTTVAVNAINLGSVPMPVACRQLAGNPMAITCEVPVPAHPLAATLGAWIESESFTQRRLYVPGVGNIPLSADLVRGGDTIFLSTDISPIDGSSITEISVGAQGVHSAQIGKYAGQLGTPIALGSVTNDLLAAGINAVSAVGSFAGGNVLGGAQGIISAVRAAGASPATIGGEKGMHPIFNQFVELESTFWTPAAQDNTNHGRPLCARRVISGLPGYIQTSGAALALAATDVERGQVTSQMDAGFFYE